MDKTAYPLYLLESSRWTQFLESVAIGLQLNLTLLTASDSYYFQVPEKCPRCGTPYPILERKDINLVSMKDEKESLEQAKTFGKSTHVVVKQLLGDIYIAVQDCSCSREDFLALMDRACIAQKLLKNFQIALRKEITGGQRAVELSTLRQMNQIILSMFHEDRKTVDHAVNLILSALIILLDAKSSWLNYKREGESYLLIKGDTEAAEMYLAGQGNSDGITVEVHNSILCGYLGVLFPEDVNKARVLLPILAQECSLAFEIDNLFKLAKLQLSRVLGVIGSAVILTDRHDIICYINTAAEEMLGFGVVDLIGIPAASLNAPWTQAALSTKESRVNGTMERLVCGSEIRWVDWQVCPLREESLIMGCLILVTDRTDYHRSLEAIRRAERIGITSTMVGALAHELRNPLTAARGLVQLMSQAQDLKKVTGYTDIILHEIDRVTCLLNEFLLLGKPAQISKEPLDMVGFLQGLVPLLQGEALGASVEILTDFKAVPAVIADPGQITQVVLNLVRNAVEATAEHGRVELSLGEQGSWVELAVKDSGRGLTPKVMEKLFQPFFTTKERGTGLGLSICQAIIHNHGGSIIPNNAPDGGALFSILLPAYTSVDGKLCYIDVMIAVEDSAIRYPVEQVIRSDGLRTVSTSDLASIFSMSEYYHPTILITDQSHINPDDIEHIKKCWMGVKTLILGEPEEGTFIKGMKDVQYTYYPLDYGRLISQVKAILSSSHDK